MSKVTTKDKVLAAARRLFVEHGFAGTSMGNIAKLAGVTHSLLFHHFGNKEKLWGEVKQSIINEASDESTMIPSTDLSFRDFLQEAFNNNIHFFEDNPDIIRLINWQRLESKTQETIKVGLTQNGEQWLAAFQHYQSTGDIHSDHKIEFVLKYYFAIAVSASLEGQAFIKNDAEFKDYIDFCVERCLLAFQCAKTTNVDFTHRNSL